MRRIDLVYWVGTPEEADRRDAEFYRNLDPSERVDMMLEIINARTDPSQRRLERTWRFTHVPLRVEK